MGIFYGNGRPFLTAMINWAHTPEDVFAGIRRGLAMGTDAFGVQIEQFEPQYKNRETLKAIFEAAEGKPFYITNYRRGNSQPELSDDAIAEQMLMAVEAGAVLMDVYGDIFCKTEGEMTYDEKAVEKQKSLIRELHRLGAEVLMSSHVLKFLPPDEVVALAKTQYSRGVDIAKIVTAANSEDELLDNFIASARLRKELPIDSLFLCGGSEQTRHRRFAPVIGSDIVLCIPETEPSDRIGQPPIGMLQQIFSYAGQR